MRNEIPFQVPGVGTGRRKPACWACNANAVSSGVNLEHVLVAHDVIATDLLSAELAAAPEAGEFERVRDLRMHEPRHVVNGVTTAYGKRFVLVGYKPEPP